MNPSCSSQRAAFVDALAEYAEQPALKQVSTESWRLVLRALADITATGRWTIFLEEFQWMCGKDSELISELKSIIPYRSTIQGLAENSFLPNSFFSTEKDRVFVSALAKHQHYEEIVELLSNERFLTQPEIAKRLSLVGGGNLSKLLVDLQLSALIERYLAVDAEHTSRNVRFRIRDNYLQFYARFIKPILAQIQRGAYRDQPQRALQLDAFEQWLGCAFERLCISESHQIAKILGFSGIEYQAGSWFRRVPRGSTDTERGFQIDLVFERADKVYTLCEMKRLSRPVDVQVAREIVEKFSLAKLNPKYSRQRVLISTNGVTPEVIRQGFFDRVINLEDLIAPNI